MLCCDKCPRVFHIQCSGLSRAPEGDEEWYCPVCKVGVCVCFCVCDAWEGGGGERERDCPIHGYVSVTVLSTSSPLFLVVCFFVFERVIV